MYPFTAGNLRSMMRQPSLVCRITRHFKGLFRRCPQYRTPGPRCSREENLRCECVAHMARSANGWTRYGPLPSKRRFRLGIDRYSQGMPGDGSSREESLASERDFYRRLLDLGGKEEIEPLLDEALALIVGVTGASTAYLELYDDEANRPRFWKGYHCTDRDIPSIRASISRGIIARAIGEGRTIETPSASLDARFSDLGSVRQNLIQAVLCAPVWVKPP